MAAKQRRGVADTPDAGAQRLNVRINPAAYQRLMIHCVMGGKLPGRLIEDLINAHCRDYRVQAVSANRSVPVTTDDRLEIDAGVSLGSVAAA